MQRADLGAAPEPDLPEPVGIGERLPRRRDDVGVAAREHALRLRRTGGCRRRRRPASRSPRRARRRGSRAAAATLRAERAALVRDAPSACTRSRSARCTDTRPRRPSAAWRPRTCRPSTARGSRSQRARARRRSSARRRRGCRPRCTSSQRKRQPTTQARADARAHRGEHLERQPHALLARAAVAVGARVQRREERRHRVGVRVVQLDAVEAGRFARAAASANSPGSTRGSSRMCGRCDVGHPLAVALNRSASSSRASRTASSSSSSSVASRAHVGLGAPLQRGSPVAREAAPVARR